MNFSFTEDEVPPAQERVSDSFGAGDNEDSFGGNMNDSFSRQDHAPMNMVDDELVNAVPITCASPDTLILNALEPIQEEQVL